MARLYKVLGIKDIGDYMLLFIILFFRNCCCVLDHIIETAFSFAPAMNSIYLVIQEQYKVRIALTVGSHGYQ